MSRDEFEHYDFSEFTEEELVQFERNVANNLLQKPDDGPEILPISKASTSGGGGPTLDIAFESPTDAFLVEEFPKPAISARNCDYLLPASTSLPLQRTSTSLSRKRPPKKGKNPYEQFCSWKKGFSVTDLVSPVWCEVQYEYGLYGERYKPLERRPSTFTSRGGKEIQVQQNVAQHNDVTLKKGTSIHKALERELRPETVPVRITTNEERWALRLFNLTAGLEQLILDGQTRELPVFGVTHGHVVFGIIDEVARRAPEAHEYHNPIKRNYISPDISPFKKKQRRSSFSSKQDIPTVYLDKSIPEEACIPEQLPSEEEVHNTSVIENSTRRPIHPQPTFYDLTLIDYKTRRVPSLPPEEDTVSSQLQLMLYHRLLSALLLPETFDFDALWAKQGINPHMPFSRSFVEDIGWSTEDLLEFHVDLCSMVAAWVSAVHSARRSGEPLRGISPELQIIYRKTSAKKNSNSFYSWQKKSGSEYKAAENHLGALAREEMDIARAIEESLFMPGQESGDSAVTQVILGNVKNTPAPHSEEPGFDEAVDLNSPLPDGPELRLAAQGSLPTCTSSITGFKAQVKEREGTDAPTNLGGSEDRILPNRKDETLDEDDASNLSMILGTRKFFMDDDRLDAHLKDILQWWFGIRPPKGVEVAQSRRCFTCEYRDGCEWREQKSQEARIALERHRESK